MLTQGDSSRGWIRLLGEGQHHNASESFLEAEVQDDIMSSRLNDLGQYIFVKAIKGDSVQTKKPSW